MTCNDHNQQIRVRKYDMANQKFIGNNLTRGTKSCDKPQHRMTHDILARKEFGTQLLVNRSTSASDALRLESKTSAPTRAEHAQ